jgi:hypothetical protein
VLRRGGDHREERLCALLPRLSPRLRQFCLGYGLAETPPEERRSLTPANRRQMVRRIRRRLADDAG